MTGPPAPASPPLIAVAAGVLTDAAGRILLARRPDRAHAGGFWEFPGGKLEPGEEPRAGLCRELAEEIGIRVEDAEPLVTYRHAYPERVVELHVFRVTAWTGEPRGLEGQPLRWVRRDDLPGAGLLPADLPVIEALGRD